LPSLDGNDTRWTSSQYVRAILATAVNVGIKRCRWGGDSAGPTYPWDSNVNPPLCGNDVLKYLDGYKMNVQQLAELTVQASAGDLDDAHGTRYLRSIARVAGDNPAAVDRRARDSQKIGPGKLWL
jgi:hypothetical protein